MQRRRLATNRLLEIKRPSAPSGNGMAQDSFCSWIVDGGPQAGLSYVKPHHGTKRWDQEQVVQKSDDVQSKVS